MKLSYQLRVLLCSSLALAGCNVCAKLDERMCNDLGPEDCTLWKENGMNFEAQAEGREGRRHACAAQSQGAELASGSVKATIGS